MEQASRNATPHLVTAARKAGQTEGSYYRPELDVVRFIAFAAVFLHHSFPGHTPFLRTLQNSFAFGMCLFFFLSSFLITELLQREKVQTGRIHISAFYARRVLRIWPLYFGYLLFGIAYGFFVPEARLSLSLLLSFTFLTGNWWVAFHGFPPTPVGVLWSISLEEQFYLTWPFLNKFGRRRSMAIICVLILLASALCEVVLAATAVVRMQAVWVNSFVQCQFFAWGALLSLRLAGRTPQLSGLFRTAMLSGSLALFFLAERAFRIISFAPRPTSLQLVCGYLMVSIACILLVSCMLGMDGRYLPRPLLYLGKVSYGLYVFHGLCTGLARTAVAWLESASAVLAAHAFLGSALRGSIAFALTLLLAAISYRYFESPFLKLKDRFAFVRSRSV